MTKPRTLGARSVLICLLSVLAGVVGANEAITPDTGGTARPAPFEQAATTFPAFEFPADEGVPPEFSAEDGSALAVVPYLFRQGSGSLEWRWGEPGAAIRFEHPDAFRNLTGADPPEIVYQWVTACPLSALCFMLFNPKAVEDVLWVKIGDGEWADARFYVSLNFTGWQNVRAWYGRDIPGFPDPETATTLRLRAPQSLAEGTLYIDLFSPCRELDIRSLSFHEKPPPNPAVPWVNNPLLHGDERDLADGRPPSLPYLPRPHGYHEFREHGTILPERPRLDIPVPEELDEGQKALLAQLTRRFRDPSPPGPRELTPDAVARILAIREERNIRRHGEVVSGNIGRPPRDYWRDVGRVGAAWHRAAGQPEVQEELGELLRDMAELVVWQGHGASYFLRTAFVGPLFSLKPLWQEQGVFEPLLERFREMLNLDNFYDPFAEANADTFNTDLTARMAVIFAADDSPEKWRDLEAVRLWLDRTSEFGAIKSDGSFHHHWTPNFGYTVPAMPPLVQWVHFLHDTPFASEKMHRATRRVAGSFHFFSNAVHLPLTKGGRHRGSRSITYGWARAVFGRLAEIGHPDEPGGVDREMAEAYLFYADHYGQESEAATAYREMGIEPRKPEGHMAMNHSASAIHRRDDWMIFLRGNKRELMGMESYHPFHGGLNRYMNYGSLQIVSAGDPPDPSSSGWPSAGPGMTGGWDHNFWPGTTSRVLPQETLRHKFRVYEQMTEETFSGGTDLAGQGAYGLILREQYPDTADDRRIGPPRYWLGEEEYRRRILASEYDIGFRARKSWFFFDGMVVALGSGIESRDQRPVVTTLFQHALGEEAPEGGAFMACGGEAGFPLRFERGLGEARWLVDQNGNGYYLPPQEATLKVRREFAEFSDERHENKGNAEVAYLAHGAAVRRRRYEYALLMRSGPERMAEFAQQMESADSAPYRVLQRDELAHVVHWPEGKMTGYAVFDARHPVAGEWLRSVSRAAVVLVKERGDGALEIAVTDPEFGDHVEGPRTWRRGPMKPTVVYLEVRGGWRPEGPADVRAWRDGERGTTLLAVECREGLPTRFRLER